MLIRFDYTSACRKASLPKDDAGQIKMCLAKCDYSYSASSF